MSARAPRQCAGILQWFPRATAVAGVLATMAGCYTTTNVATLAPLHTAYPVSISSQYVDHDGNIVTESDYQIVHPFSFHQAVEAHPFGTTVTALALEPDLDRIMATTTGDAITAMRIQAIDYHVGSHNPAAGLKLLGWMGGTVGLVVGGFGVVGGGDLGSSLTTVGVVTAGIGVVSYLIATALKDPASWQLDVSGNVVKRKPSVTGGDPSAGRHAH